MNSSKIRRTFLEYFKGHGHTVVKSSSLVPKDDPTLLFTNAGMVQFKDVFLGLERKPYVRAASCQKCVRAGGKHSDLENVGHTPRHHTFFEMLGNFSFGDYFKREAIGFAWELLTEVFHLPAERLWVTVYEEDDEALDLWVSEVGVPRDKVVKLGEKDNFWSMGDTGPCGPCSEVLYDLGGEGPTLAEDPDSERYLELWNLVFMQYNRDADGNLSPLPRPSIDTGMGLERIASVLQGVRSNYDTDLFRDIIGEVERVCGRPYGRDRADDVSMRVVADHARAVTFLIADGVVPSNEGRGYVLRRILRRAVRHLRRLGVGQPALYVMTEVVKDIMAEAYPELEERIEFVKEVVKGEEERFFETIDRGLEILAEELARHRRALPGEVAFKLYDTYGFPLDLTEDIARESGISVDREGFEREMARQRERSRSAWKAQESEALTPIYKVVFEGGLVVQFTGYERLEDEGEIKVLIRGDTPVDEAREGETVELITDRTPFYGESGGQVGDRGTIEAPDGSARVVDTKRPLPTLIVHLATVTRGVLRVGDSVRLAVDRAHRQGAMAHHTATHILHAVLREIVGDHVQQAGSLVAPERLRFDFTHFTPLDHETVARIEEVINSRVRLDDEVVVETNVPYEEAIRSGATAIFEEKYGDRVRVVTIGDYSKELCGGTHLHTTGEAGLIKIVHETASAAGVRRIEAVAGEAAWRHLKDKESRLHEAAAVLRVPEGELVARLKKLVKENETLRRELASLKESLSRKKAQDLVDATREVDGVKVISAEVEDATPGELRTIWDDLKGRLKRTVAVLGSRKGGKAYLLVGVTKDVDDELNAGRLIKRLAPIIGGGGGGKAELAQAGGTKTENLRKALDAALSVVKAERSH